MASIPERVIAIISCELDHPVNASTKLLDMDCDSLEFLELMLILENEFGRKVPDEAIAKFHTAGDIARFFA